MLGRPLESGTDQQIGNVSQCTKPTSQGPDVLDGLGIIYLFCGIIYENFAIKNQDSPLDSNNPHIIHAIKLVKMALLLIGHSYSMGSKCFEELIRIQESYLPDDATLKHSCMQDLIVSLKRFIEYSANNPTEKVYNSHSQIWVTAEHKLNFAQAKLNQLYKNRGKGTQQETKQSEEQIFSLYRLWAPKVSGRRSLPAPQPTLPAQGNSYSMPK